MENISAMATVRFLPNVTFSSNGVCLAEITFVEIKMGHTDGNGMEARHNR